MITCRECRFWDYPRDTESRERVRGDLMRDCRGGLPEMNVAVYGQVGIWPMTVADKCGCAQGKPIPATKASVSP